MQFPRLQFPLSHFTLTIAMMMMCCLALPDSGQALPDGPRAYCETYPDIPSCQGQVVDCMQCHTSPPAFNAYGLDVVSALYSIEEYATDGYREFLGTALATIETQDSDVDGLANIDELLLGTRPGDAESFWIPIEEPVGESNVHYAVGEYDPKLAYRRTMITYCGRPPNYDEIESYLASSDLMQKLEESLDDCLKSEYWLQEGLLRLADKRIKPLEAIGFNGLIPLADYEWDYRLFKHVLTENRDARDLLRADYHIGENGQILEGDIRFENGSLYPINAPLPVGGQPLDADKRAGMITTQWFLMSQTMFSHLPRTTAAQAYRAYLGQDIARSQGLLPVPGEPLDVDNKGVSAPECAVCHSTLDPLSYAFASYDGIGGGTTEYDGYSDIISSLETTGMYLPERNPWGEESVILDEGVSNLVDWAQVASESDMFARNLAMMFWKQAIQREPFPDEQEDFLDLWQRLPAEDYAVNKMLHRLIRTDAFGVP